MAMTGKIAGYDPGGNDHHGVAALFVNNGQPVTLSFATVRNAEAACSGSLREECRLR